AVNEAVLLTGLRDRDDRVRELAAKLCGSELKSGTVSQALWSQLWAMVGDPSWPVRFQLAVSLGEGEPPGKPALLAALATRSAGTPIEDACLSSLAHGGGEFVSVLAASPEAVRVNAVLATLSRSAIMVGLQGQAGEVHRVLDAVASDRL